MANHVNGFLRRDGRRIVNDGGEVLLSGWGLGNWLLCEGYMWLSHDAPGFDRPRRIEALIRDVAGTRYAEAFWRRFLRNYITRADIMKMAEYGYNSVRIPFNWRLFMEDEPGEILWKEEGFALLDDCIAWCAEAGIYAFLDLHGAPGGQTGANIDDSRDNLPRLFMDGDYWQKALALWQKLAERYAGNPVVGGYDLLNEPIRPQDADPEKRSMEHLVPRLAQFYREAIAVIRKADKAHLFSIEGHHWATSNQVFCELFDENMLIHFHRYGVAPDIEAYKPYLDLAEYWNLPLWLGETGENTNEWYAAMFPLAHRLGIGYNLWPWKKMGCTNSPLSVTEPEGWDKLTAYARGGPKPAKDEAVRLLDAYLENVRLENCAENPAVNRSVFRTPGFTLRATDFDELPGRGTAYSGGGKTCGAYGYRQYTGMSVVPGPNAEEGERAGWSIWNDYCLRLSAGEFAAYTLNLYKDACLTLRLYAQNDAELLVCQTGGPPRALPVKKSGSAQTLSVPLCGCGEATVTLTVRSGEVLLDSLSFDT